MTDKIELWLQTHNRLTLTIFFLIFTTGIWVEILNIPPDFCKKISDRTDYAWEIASNNARVVEGLKEDWLHYRKILEDRLKEAGITDAPHD